MEPFFLSVSKIRVFAFLVLSCVILSQGCKKQEIIIVEDNDAPFYDEVPTNAIENYVNRMYIDLIGREPLDVEMESDVQYLKDNLLSMESRDALIWKLQSDTSFVEGDSSYRMAYYNRFYEVTKVRLVEGASNALFQKDIGILLNAAFIDSLLGNFSEMDRKKRKAQLLIDVIDSEHQYRMDSIGHETMFARLMNNSIYDKINMNSFNFINATFDDLFFRFPSTEEFDQSFNMIEYNLSGSVFGISGSNKTEFLDILVGSREYYEGMIRWTYLTVLAREPGTIEVTNLMDQYFIDHDYQRVQREVMKTDEYANF